MFLPTTKKELEILGWHHLDVILITGDAYIDSPFTGVAVIGKLLVKHGFTVGIIAQPDIDSDKDITRLGEPRLFWGITSGAVDSMVSNYTALKKRRKSDDYTPGGINNRRPDRAVIIYTNLVKRYFKNSCPIVLGGIEASLRRICHYDFWSNTIRRSILFDSKADYLIYGMGESAVIALAQALKFAKSGEISPQKNEIVCDQKSETVWSQKSEIICDQRSESIRDIRGLCYISKTLPSSKIHSPYDSRCLTLPPHHYLTLPPYNYLTLPSYDIVKQDKGQFAESFHIFYNNNDPLTACGMVQKHDSRYLVHNPPAFYPDTNGMDKIAAIEFERDLHPYYKQLGKVKALDTIQFSISTHRGCYGECNFCSIAVHEGKTVRWRSEESIINEAKQLTQHPNFKGIISDAGGPTANMYGFECAKKLQYGGCSDKRCLFPTICKNLKPDHSKQINLLKKIQQIQGIRKVFVASGIRYDLMFSDKNYGEKYLEFIVKAHVSGQLKVAPEHTQPQLLELMGKPNSDSLLEFKKKFDLLDSKRSTYNRQLDPFESKTQCKKISNTNRFKGGSGKSGSEINDSGISDSGKISNFTKNGSEISCKQQFLTYYLMAAHPGCTLDDMKHLKKFLQEKLHITPEQVQIFTPTPSTYSTLMYYTQISPFTGKTLFVEKNILAKEEQKKIVTSKQ